jgi:hypothetical protein
MTYEEIILLRENYLKTKFRMKMRKNYISKKIKKLVYKLPIFTKVLVHDIVKSV